MWQEPSMACRQQPAPDQQGAPQEHQQQHDGGTHDSGSTRRGGCMEEQTMQAECAALAAVRNVLLEWKTEQQERPPQRHWNNSYACTAPVSSNRHNIEEVSHAAAAVMVSSYPHAQEHISELVLQQQPSQERDPLHRTPKQQEQFLASLQQLLQLLQEQQRKQGHEQQQQQPQRGGVYREEQLPPPGAGEPRILLPKVPAAAGVRATGAVSQELRPTAAAACGGSLNSSSNSSKSTFAAGRDVLQQLLSTSAPLTYPETYAFLQSVMRRQQQEQGQQDQLLPQQLALGQKLLGVCGEEGQLRDRWCRKSAYLSEAVTAAAARKTEQRRRQEREENSKNSSSKHVNPALLLLGSPSPRYFPKPPRGSSSRFSRSNSRRTFANEDSWRSSSATEEEQFYQEWLDHVHGVYIHRYDDTDQYKDDLDPGYRILDIPEDEYINDCRRLKQHPVEMLGGRAACSKRPSPPRGAAFTTSHPHVLSSTRCKLSLHDATTPSSHLFVSAAAAAATSAAASSRDGRQCNMPSHGGGGERPAAQPAGGRTATPPLQPDAAAAEGDYEASLRSASRGSSPCFGNVEASRGFAVTAAAAAPPSRPSAAAMEGAASGAAAAAAHARGPAAAGAHAANQGGRSSPAWGRSSSSGGDDSCVVSAAEAAAGGRWRAHECPGTQNRCRSSNCMHSSRSSSLLQRGSNGAKGDTDGEANGDHSSLLTCGSITTSNSTNLLPEREKDKLEGGGSGARTGEAADGEQNLKGSVSVEDELADCKVQLAPSSSVSPYLPAGSCVSQGNPPVFPYDGGVASLLGAQQQQRRRCEEEEASSSTGGLAADVLLQEYNKEMRRAAAWRKCYCDGDAALFRQKQEHSRYRVECCCSCNCCGSREHKTNAAECVPCPSAAAAEVMATAARAADGGGGGAAGGDFSWPLAGEVAPLHASSGDDFYPVRVAGSRVLAFPRQQHEQQQREKLWQEQRLWPQEGEGDDEKQLLLPVDSRESAAGGGAPAEQLLHQVQSNSLLLQHAAARGDERVACRASSTNQRETGALPANIRQISAAATTAAAKAPNHRRNSTCSSNRGGGGRELFTSMSHSHTHELVATRTRSPSSGRQMQEQHDDAGRSCCTCSCGCSACCSFKSNNHGSTSVASHRPKSVVFDCFYLKVVFERGKTGFEDHRELVLPTGTLFAGRYLVQQEIHTMIKRLWGQVHANGLWRVGRIIPLADTQTRDLLLRLQVGRAAFSRCLRCIDTATNQLVCLKVIKNEKEYIDQSLDEVKTLRYLQANGDPDLFHYVQLLDCFYHREHLVLVTELLSDNLFQFSASFKMMKLPSFWTLGRVQRVARELLLALHFVHRLHVIHCDLKPENVLLRPSFVTNLASYEGLEGKYPLNIIREAARQAAAAAYQSPGGAATVAASAAGGEQRAAKGDAPANPLAGVGRRQRIAGLTALGGEETETAAAPGVGRDGGVGANNGHFVAAAQLRQSLQVNSDSRRSQDATAEQHVEAAAAVCTGSSNNNNDSRVLQHFEEAERQRHWVGSGMLQQQDCYERPKKQQYLQQQSLTQQSLHAGESCVQPQQLHLNEFVMQQYALEQVQEQLQYNSASRVSHTAEKGEDSVSPLGRRVGKRGDTVVRETAATAAGPTSSAVLSPSECCGSNSSLSGACATPHGAPASGRRCAVVQRVEHERPTATAAERTCGADGYATRRCLRDFVAEAAAAAAEDLSVKLIDFGNSCRTSDALVAYVQSRSYRAPEVLLELPYGSKIDIWSLGCVLFELFTGVVLFLNEGVHSLLARIVGIIGQLPWYMVDSSPKKHTYFDADGYLYTVLQDIPPFPVSAPPILSSSAAGGGCGISAEMRGVSAGMAVPHTEVVAAARGEDATAAWSQEDIQPRLTGGGGAPLTKSNSSTTCYSKGSCGNSGDCLSSVPDQQQQQGDGGKEWDASKGFQGVAGVVSEKVHIGAAESGKEKRIYERASQDTNGCEESLRTPSVTVTEGEQRPAAGEARTRAAAGDADRGAPCFGREAAVSQECGETAAGATGAVTGPCLAAAGGPAKTMTKTVEGGRIFRFLLPKQSSLRQRLRVDDSLFIDFLERMLKIDPVERWSAEQLLRHPFLQKGLYADGL